MKHIPTFAAGRTVRLFAALAMGSLAASPASAQGLFDLFGMQRPAPPAQSLAYADPAAVAPRAAAPYTDGSRRPRPGTGTAPSAIAG